MSLLQDDGGHVVTVRPGRRLFLRNVWIGGTTGHRSSNINLPPCLLTVVMVHGSCATELQYRRLLEAMHKQLQQQQLLLASKDPGEAGAIRCVLYDMAGCGQSPEPERSSRTSYSPYSNEQSIQDLKAVIRRCCCNRSSDDNDDDKRIGTTTMSKDSNCVPSSDSSPSPSPLILVGHSYASNLILPLLLEAMEQRRRKRKRHGDSGDDEDSLPLGAISGAVLLSGALRTPSNPLPDGGSSLVTTLPSFLLRCLQPALTASFVGAAFAAGAGPGNNSKGTERDDDCEDSSNVIIARELTDMCNGNSMRVVQAYHSEMKWLSLLHCDNDERNGGGGDTLTTVEGAETDPGVAQENASAAATPPPHLPRVWIVHGREDRIIPLQAGQDMAQVLSRLMAATTVTSASAIASSAAASATLPNNDTEAVVAATPAFHVLDGAGHMIMMEQPRRVATLLLGFLVELSP